MDWKLHTDLQSDSKRLVPIGSKIVIINTNCEIL